MYKRQVSRQGLLDLSMSLDQIGPLSNDTSGIALALNAISDYDETECTTLHGKRPDFTSALEEKSLEGMKIAVCKEFIDVTDTEINVAVNKAIHKLVEAGAEMCIRDRRLQPKQLMYKINIHKQGLHFYQCLMNIHVRYDLQRINYFH